MTSKVIQVTFTEYEFQHLTKKADEEGLTLSLYIKSKVLDDTEFKNRFADLLKRVNGIPDGTKFNVKAVFGIEWAGIDKGVRLALGKAFYNYVVSGKLPKIEEIQGKIGSTQWYLCK
ncbi:DUF1413 domain-containing protein [Youngiibacter multivorans]|uniref:Uncharacterized protein n=1 Tax=Youngiibacter multivorans TaxID=937251 RepID=A0ABS4G797_9CLOT|nr:DUF1413 domain-containing protein [Youngiibacter multivorans]MBP1920312.1 hypothetical protein [Youngiibacter multivorans]